MPKSKIASKLKTINHKTSKSKIREMLIGNYLYTDAFETSCVISEEEISLDSPLLSNICCIGPVLLEGFVIKKVNKLSEDREPWGLEFITISQDSSLICFIDFLSGCTPKVGYTKMRFTWGEIVFL